LRQACRADCAYYHSRLLGFGYFPDPLESSVRTRLLVERFTVKDFFLFAFLGLLLVMILLAMYMVDRQWMKMAEMQRTLNEQALNLQELARSL
jgi:hypothetical protein